MPTAGKPKAEGNLEGSAPHGLARSDAIGRLASFPRVARRHASLARCLSDTEGGGSPPVERRLDRGSITRRAVTLSLLLLRRMTISAADALWAIPRVSWSGDAKPSANPSADEQLHAVAVAPRRTVLIYG